MMNLLLIDDCISEKDVFINSALPTTKPVLFSAFESIEYDSIKRIAIAFHGSYEIPEFIRDNLVTIIDNCGPSLTHIDFLGCRTLQHQEWLDYYSMLGLKYTGIQIGASDDDTGNVKYGGDWVMENATWNHGQEDVVGIYFNEGIGEYIGLLAVGVVFTVSGIKYRPLTESGTTSTVAILIPTTITGPTLTIPPTVVNGTITYTVTQLGDGAYYPFANTNTTLTAVSGGANISTISDYAFYNFTALTIIPEFTNATSLGDYAFRNCSALQQVIGFNKVTIFGGTSAGNSNAFRDCSSITIVNGFNAAGFLPSIFYGCKNLKTIIGFNKVITYHQDVFAFAAEYLQIYGFNLLTNYPSFQGVTNVIIISTMTPTSCTLKTLCNWTSPTLAIPIPYTNILTYTIKQIGDGTNYIFNPNQNGNASTNPIQTIQGANQTTNGIAIENFTSLKYLFGFTTFPTNIKNLCGFSTPVNSTCLISLFNWNSDTLTIPEKVNNITVTAVGDGTAIFKTGTNIITTIVGTTSIKDIKTNAFQNFTGLQTAIFNSITNCAASAFSGCANFNIFGPASASSLNLLTGVINWSVYSWITGNEYSLNLLCNWNLISLTIPETTTNYKITTIGNGVDSIFKSGTNNIETIIENGDAQTIKQNALKGFKSPLTLDGFNKVTVCDSFAFDGLNLLNLFGFSEWTNPAFGDTITNVMRYSSTCALISLHNWNMSILTIPDNVNNINVDKIGDGTNPIFQTSVNGNNPITTIIQTTDKTIAENAFTGFTLLANVVGFTEFPNPDIIGFSIISSSECKLDTLFNWTYQILPIPEKVSDYIVIEIGDGTNPIFNGSENPITTIINEASSVTRINEQAFYNFSQLHTVIGFNQVSDCGLDSFDKCSSLNTVLGFASLLQYPDFTDSRNVLVLPIENCKLIFPTRGFSGAFGKRGVQGPRGVQGKKGVQGPRGVRGPKGPG